jgi:hypothetical protein
VNEHAKNSGYLMHGPCQDSAVTREPLQLSIRTILSASYDKAADSITPVGKPCADGYAPPVEYLCPDYPEYCPPLYALHLWINAHGQSEG